jgi:hypothetical protein
LNVYPWKGRSGPWALAALDIEDGLRDAHSVAVPIWQGEACPACGGDLRMVGFFLSFREEDQKRVCRTPLWCATCDAVWGRWADREDPLERELPLPKSMTRSLLGPE